MKERNDKGYKERLELDLSLMYLEPYSYAFDVDILF